LIKHWREEEREMSRGERKGREERNEQIKPRGHDIAVGMTLPQSHIAAIALCRNRILQHSHMAALAYFLKCDKMVTEKIGRTHKTQYRKDTRGKEI